MNDKTYHSPLNGEELHINENGVLTNKSDNVNFIVTNSDVVVPLIDPITGAKLIKKTDSLYESVATGTCFTINNNGQIKPLISPLDSSPLYKLDNGLYASQHNEIKYEVDDLGEVNPLLDPRNGALLYKNENGKLVSEYTSDTYELNSKGKVIPLWDPVTKGKAHLEGDVLVSDVTGERYEIDEHGTILTPEQIKHNQKNEELARQLEEKLYQNPFSILGEKKLLTSEQIKDVIDDKNNNPERLTKNDIERIISGESKKNDLSELKKIKQVLQAAKVVKKQSQQPINNITMSLEDFLNNNNISSEKDMVNYLCKMGLNPKIIETLSKINGTNFLGIINGKKNAMISIVDMGDKKALYVPTTKDNATSEILEVEENGNLKLVSSKHSPLMINGIRYGSTSVVDFSVMMNGDLECVESLHQVSPYDGLKPNGTKTRYEVRSKQTPVLITCDGQLKQDMTINRHMVCESLNDGILEPVVKTEEEFNEFEQMKEMGYNDAYFRKPQITGENYDYNGNKTVCDSENLSVIPELSIYKYSNIQMQNNDPVLNKTMSGFVDAFILALIVGFVSGLGIGILLLIIK